MNTDEILVDLQATKAFITGEITEHADTTDFEECVSLVDELRRVEQCVRDAITMLNGSLLKQLEGGTRQIGTRVYASVEDSVKRTNHDKVRAQVIGHAVSRATDKNTGEVMARVAADVATDLMMDLYVTPSKVATTRALRRMGITPKQVNAYEFKGRKLRIVDLAMPKDDDDDDE